MRKNFNFISEGASEKDVWFQNPDNKNLLIQLVSELTFNDWMDYLDDDFSRAEEIMEMENDKKAAEMFEILHYENLVELSSLNDERKDESLEKNIWWEQHSEELINYARDLEYDDWLNFFNGDDTRVQPTMDSSDKEKAMTLLHILNIANLDGIINEPNISNQNIVDCVKTENKLPHDFVEQIRRIYEVDSNAIICGSTALFLYGLIDRIPNDIDVIVSNESQVLQLKDYYSDSDEYQFDEHDTMEKLSNPIVLNRISNIAKNASSIYTYMGAVKYMLGGEQATHVNMPTSVYDEVLGLWKKHRGTNESLDVSTGFEYAFTGKEITKVCVFERKGEVEHTQFSLYGINILLESPAVILEHKKLYDRDKDKQDIFSITN